MRTERRTPPLFDAAAARSRSEPAASRAGAIPAAACVLLCALALPAVADAPVRIVSPDARTVVYGRTSVRVEGPSSLSYRVYRKLRPGSRGSLVCNLPRRPKDGECTFDAGTSFASEHLVVEGVDRRGRVVGRDEVRTYFFQRPDVSVTSSPNLLVEIALDGPGDAVRRAAASARTFGCEVAGAPCRVASIRRSRTSGLLRVTLLIDESNSMARAELDLLRPALQAFVEKTHAYTDGSLRVEFDIRFFSEEMRSATYGFTADLDEIGTAVLSGDPSGGTCLYRTMTELLRELSFYRAKDRAAGRDATDALVVWSDGQDACPSAQGPAMSAMQRAGGAHAGGVAGAGGAGGAADSPARSAGRDPASRRAAQAPLAKRFGPRIDDVFVTTALENARWSDVPIYVVPIELTPPCPTGWCEPDEAFLELGERSGGATFDVEDGLPGLLATRIVDDLMSRFVVELESATDTPLARSGPLVLTAGNGVTVRHREIVGEQSSRRELALEILRADSLDIEAKAAAADYLSKAREPVMAFEAELIYDELTRFIREVGRDLEDQAREEGHDGAAEFLRSWRRGRDKRLTRRELAIVRMLEPRARETFMRARVVLLEALITSAGRSLLWESAESNPRRYLRLLERMKSDGYWLTNPTSRLPIYLRTYLDEDFAADASSRRVVRAILED